ncbi:MAG: PilZ domain-containing protein [Nitrospirota bacterium]|nr:PilZ domain-containing protein [Nitrospirota bacterium]
MRERRDNPRVEIKGDVLVYYRAGKSLINVTDDVAIKDVSTGGAKVSSETPFPLSLAVNMNIDLPGGSIKMQGSVVHIEEIADKDAYDIGIKFFGITQDDAQRLTRFISEHSEHTHETTGNPPAENRPADQRPE